MAFVSYTSDFGIVYYAIPFSFFIKENNNAVNNYTLNDLVPQSILNVLQELNSQDKIIGCILPKDIKPRMVEVKADDNNIYSFMFPFNFTDINFNGSILEMNENEIIREYTIIGEKIKTNKLNFILGINGY